MDLSLGARIRVARETKKLTIDEVARTLGRPLSWLSNLETGRTKNLPEPYQCRQLVGGIVTGQRQPFGAHERYWDRAGRSSSPHDDARIGNRNR